MWEIRDIFLTNKSIAHLNVPCPTFMHQMMSYITDKYLGMDNFIMGASGSDKLLLCRSSRARADPSMSVVNKIKKGMFVIHRCYEMD